MTITEDVISKKLKIEDLIMKKPGHGMPASMIIDCIGRTANKNLYKDKILMKDDLN